MALLEILMKPLLDAQLEAGIEIGKAEVTKEFEAWKERQRAAGVEFVDDDEPENDESPPSDQ